MSNWKEYTLGDISRNISRRFDFNAYPNVVFINTGDVLNNKFLHCDISNVKDLPGQAKKAIKKGDILYSEIRPGNGRYLFVDNDLDNYVVSTKFMVIEPNANIVLPEFLFLLLISNETTEYFKMIAESRSGTFPQITFDSVSSLSLNIPDKETQQKILDIIIPLDGKIEINTQINQTLEQISQALFKSWFVDFDPVRAKVQALSDGLSLEQAELAAMQAISGKTPEELTALSQTQPERYAELAETAKAFPCEMVEVDGVEVPKGWELSTIGEEVETVGGATPSTKEESFWNNGKIAWTTPKDLSSATSPVLINAERKITELGLKKISSGLLPIGTVLLSSRAPVGYLALTKIPVAINQGYIAIKCNKTLSNFYMLQWCKENLEEIKSRASGTTFLEISKTTFRGISVIVPEKNILIMFNKQCESIYEMITTHTKENQDLEKARDLLLPRLLKGEILNG